MVRSVSDSFDRGKARCQGHTYNSSSWWTGEAGKVLRSEYSDIEVEINNLVRQMSELEKCIRKLSGDVQRADNERKQRAAEALKKQNYLTKGIFP